MGPIRELISRLLQAQSFQRDYEQSEQRSVALFGSSLEGFALDWASEPKTNFSNEPLPPPDHENYHGFVHWDPGILLPGHRPHEDVSISRSFRRTCKQTDQLPPHTRYSGNQWDGQIRNFSKPDFQRGRKQNAEVDRVWSVTPSIFAQPITYVLECKWGLVRKRDVDDFLEVLKWSTEFGVNTSEGRTIKQGLVGVFAGSAFNPKENVRLKDETEISLATYAARINIQLLKAADFNEKLRERGIPKETTVQGVCRAAKDEKDVREVLLAIWEAPEKSSEILSKAIGKNKDVYDFEKMLESVSRNDQSA